MGYVRQRLTRHQGWTTSLVSPRSSLHAQQIFVTVQGQVSGLKAAAQQLNSPRPRPHSLPDIVFLPSSTSILALDEVVSAKPHVLVRTDDLDRARELQQRGNISGSMSVAGTSQRSSFGGTPAVTSMGAVGVLTPPPGGKKGHSRSSRGINAGLLDAADVMSQEDARRGPGKLSPRSLTFDDSGEERGGEVIQGELEDEKEWEEEKDGVGEEGKAREERVKPEEMGPLDI